MKRCLALFVALLLLLPAAALAIANPWLDISLEELAARTGVVVRLPEGVEDGQTVAYRLLPEMNLAEVQFTWQGWRCVFRAMPEETLTDITGLYYTWAVQADCTVGSCAGYVWEAEDAAVCLWYDGARSCSFAVLGPDAATVDVRAAAEAITAPLRLADVLRGCTGFAGTAGATLKAARAACGLLALEGVQAGDVPLALQALSAEEKEELALNLPTLDWLVTGVLAGDEAVLATFADAGVTDIPRDVMPMLTAEDWAALMAALDTVLTP